MADHIMVPTITYTPPSIPRILSVSPPTVSSIDGSSLTVTVANLGTGSIGSQLVVVFGGATGQLYGSATVQSADIAQLSATVTPPDLTALTVLSNGAAITGMIPVPLKVYWDHATANYDWCQV